ncbi:hypothetical protein DRZ78_00020 [Candidatus Aerophobetes bacterium]|uniref:Uncharacterized protein n=1 Tax=Aerophobetes bacterium TaxID=2030807 RepID=A0A662D6J1_UNCAE|nr:MAG: hypothetical protein DRZ78_00020 [Candidatus Aerophobetes bacterium]
MVKVKLSDNPTIRNHGYGLYSTGEGKMGEYVVRRTTGDKNTVKHPSSARTKRQRRLFKEAMKIYQSFSYAQKDFYRRRLEMVTARKNMTQSKTNALRGKMLALSEIITKLSMPASQFIKPLQFCIQALDLANTGIEGALLEVYCMHPGIVEEIKTLNAGDILSITPPHAIKSLDIYPKTEQPEIRITCTKGSVEVSGMAVAERPGFQEEVVESNHAKSFPKTEEGSIIEVYAENGDPSCRIMTYYDNALLISYPLPEKEPASYYNLRRWDTLEVKDFTSSCQIKIEPQEEGGLARCYVLNRADTIRVDYYQPGHGSWSKTLEKGEKVYIVADGEGAFVTVTKEGNEVKAWIYSIVQDVKYTLDCGCGAAPPGTYKGYKQKEYKFYPKDDPRMIEFYSYRKKASYPIIQDAPHNVITLFPTGGDIRVKYQAQPAITELGPKTLSEGESITLWIYHGTTHIEVKPLEKVTAVDLKCLRGTVEAQLRYNMRKAYVYSEYSCPDGCFPVSAISPEYDPWSFHIQHPFYWTKGKYSLSAVDIHMEMEQILYHAITLVNTDTGKEERSDVKKYCRTEVQDDGSIAYYFTDTWGIPSVEQSYEAIRVICSRLGPNRLHVDVQEKKHDYTDIIKFKNIELVTCNPCNYDRWYRRKEFNLRIVDNEIKVE